MNKIILTLLTSILFTITLQAQTYTLNVVNGYGSGSYEAGDTVHVWSIAYDTTQTFNEWTGDIATMQNPKEWHSTLVMPARNINIQAVLQAMPAYTIRYEVIRGVSNLKNVYSCFPSGMKGIIYLLHGTSGSASNWISVVEYRSFIDAAIADHYGIIVTEAEEITLNTDLNGDGKLRWQTLPFDSVSGIDYQNIKIITDTFIRRGNINYSTPKFSVGMSNGGSYSAFLSTLYNYKAGVSYCASSAQTLFTLRNNPFAFRMALYDDNAEVGPTGNYQASQADSILAYRGICHDYDINNRQPIYAARFARIPGVSLATSQAIFNELLTNGQLDSLHYAIHSDSIKNHVIARPILYPTIIGLGAGKILEALNQISASNAEHKFYSDYNAATLNFFNYLCNDATGVAGEEKSQKPFILYPNPASTSIQLDLASGQYDINIIDLFGRSVMYIGQQATDTPINIAHLTTGTYYIQAKNASNVFSTRFIKQ